MGAETQTQIILCEQYEPLIIEPTPLPQGLVKLFLDKRTSEQYLDNSEKWKHI